MITISRAAAGLILELSGPGYAPEGAGPRITIDRRTRQPVVSMVPGPGDGDRVLDVPGGAVLYVDVRSAGELAGQELDALVDAEGAARFVLRPPGTLAPVPLVNAG